MGPRLAMGGMEGIFLFFCRGTGAAFRDHFRGNRSRSFSLHTRLAAFRCRLADQHRLIAAKRLFNFLQLLVISTQVHKPLPFQRKNKSADPAPPVSGAESTPCSNLAVHLNAKVVPQNRTAIEDVNSKLLRQR